MYVPLPLAFIDVPVSDAALAGSIVKQLPRWHRLVLEQDINPDSPSYGQLTVEASFLVRVFAVDEFGNIGERLPQGKAFSDYPVKLIGDDNCAVYFDPADGANPRNGEILYLSGDLDAAEWRQFLETVPEPVAEQGRVLNYLLHHAGAEGSQVPPVVIAQMLRTFIRQADTAPGAVIANKFTLR